MRFSRPLLATIIAAALVAQPLVVEAKAGATFARSGASGTRSVGPSGGLVRAAPQGKMTYQSQGTRGERTAAPVQGAQSIARSTGEKPIAVQNNNAGLGSSVTRSPQLSAPAAVVAAAPVAAAAAMAPSVVSPAAPSFAQRHPVMTGMMAGMGGAYLYDHFFGNHSNGAVMGNGGMGSGGSGFATGTGGGIGSDANYGLASNASRSGGGLSTLLLLLALGGIGFFLYRRFAGNKGSSGADIANSFGNSANMQTSTSYTVTADDEKVFKALLTEIQKAWSAADLHALATFATGEMVQYYKEALDGNSSQGVHNAVENVQNVQASVQESWREGQVVYATARMKWSSVDYTFDTAKQPNDVGYVIDGNKDQYTEADEIWTFARHVDGDWILSAVQQLA